MKLSPKFFFVSDKSTKTFIYEQMREAHPEAKVILISTNTRVLKPDYGLLDLNPKNHFKEKKEKIALLHRNAAWRADPNGRSTDFLPVQMMTEGCAFGCTYCYTERRYPNNFAKLYDDVFEIVGLIKKVVGPELNKHVKKFSERCRKEFEKHRDPLHPDRITFDLGCNSDCVIDNRLTANKNYEGHIVDIMNRVSQTPNAMTSFATKSAEIQPFIDGCVEPQNCRIRMSLMPEHLRAKLEMGTSKTTERLHAVNSLAEAGFETHINLSPICVTSDFQKEYADLLDLIDETLTDKAKSQLAYEVIFLTHSNKLFEPVSNYAPKAHRLMTDGPLPLVPKPNKPNVLSYDRGFKGAMKKWLKQQIEKKTPYARVRYAF